MCGFDSCYPCILKKLNKINKIRKYNKIIFSKKKNYKYKFNLNNYHSWNFYKRSKRRILRFRRVIRGDRRFYKNVVVSNNSRFFLSNFKRRKNLSKVLSRYKKYSYSRAIFFNKNLNYKTYAYLVKGLFPKNLLSGGLKPNSYSRLFVKSLNINPFTSKGSFSSLKLPYKSKIQKLINPNLVNSARSKNKKLNYFALSKNVTQLRNTSFKKNYIGIFFKKLNITEISSFSFYPRYGFSNFFLKDRGLFNPNVNYLCGFTGLSPKNYYTPFFLTLNYLGSFILGVNSYSTVKSNFLNNPGKFLFNTVKPLGLVSNLELPSGQPTALSSRRSNTILSWSNDNTLWGKKSLFYKNTIPVLTSLETFRITGDVIAYSGDNTRNIFNKTVKPANSGLSSSVVFLKPSYPFFIFMHKFLTKNTISSDKSLLYASDKLNFLPKIFLNSNHFVTTQKFIWLNKALYVKKLSGFLNKNSKVRYKFQSKLRRSTLGVRYLKPLVTNFRRNKKNKQFLKSSLSHFLQSFRKTKASITKATRLSKRYFFWKLPRVKFNFFKTLSFISKNKRSNILSYFSSESVINPKFINKTNFFTKTFKNFLPTTNLAFKVGYTPNTFTGQANLFKKFGIFWGNYLAYNNFNLLTFFFKNPFFLKLSKPLSFAKNSNLLCLARGLTLSDSALNTKFSSIGFKSSNLLYSNLVPHTSFNYILSKKIYSMGYTQSMRVDLVPWYYHTLIRFIENCSGKKVMFQFYPFVNQEITKDFIVRYKKWMPRMSFYERRLGHKFFLEEALHILHIGFVLRDPVLLSSWLKAMILRISFWKTKSIFRFLKYLLYNYYRFIFSDLGIKGLKLKLKGKISAAGNSRKRTILYRIGSTSHSTVNLRVAYDSKIISTFTGVMGFQVWLFY